MTQSPNESRLPSGVEPVTPYRASEDGSTFALVRTHSKALALHVVGNHDAFRGEPAEQGILCSLSPENGLALSERFDWLRPRRIPEDRPSFGFGDRIGLATPGHIRALRSSASIFPILAQQSVRENTRTGRSFSMVLADAVFGAFRQGYDRGFGADADHLKETTDALEAARLRYSFFTCDPGDRVEQAEKLSLDEIRSRFAEIVNSREMANRYAGRSYAVGEDLFLHISEENLMRAAVKYGGAIDHATRMYETLVDELGSNFDYEVSVDETDAPTTPLEHLFVALELRRRGVEFVSLAPRFVGAMEKGVDWRGKIEQFSSDLAQHALIARSVGGYRLSLHSGSDKFSIYPQFASETNGRCHVKTAGTSYLVALEVIARRDPELFRSLAIHSLAAFAEDKATYHISADPSRIPAIESLADKMLVDLIAAHDSRQVLHVAFGSVLQSKYMTSFRNVLEQHEEDHFVALAKHLGRHIDGLEVTSNA